MKLVNKLTICPSNDFTAAERLSHHQSTNSFATKKLRLPCNVNDNVVADARWSRRWVSPSLEDGYSHPKETLEKTEEKHRERIDSRGWYRRDEVRRGEARRGKACSAYTFHIVISGYLWYGLPCAPVLLDTNVCDSTPGSVTSTIASWAGTRFSLVFAVKKVIVKVSLRIMEV